MNQPSLQEITEIGNLLDKIGECEKLIESASLELEDTKKYYEVLEGVEKSKIHEDLKQKNALVELNNYIDQYRKQEISQKTSLISYINSNFDDFILSSEMKVVIKDVIKNFKDEEYQISCDDRYQLMLPDGLDFKKNFLGHLRIYSNTKEYVLDPVYLKSIVSDNLLVSTSFKN